MTHSFVFFEKRWFLHRNLDDNNCIGQLLDFPLSIWGQVSI